MTNPNIEQLTGMTRQHLTPCWSGALVHVDVLSSLECLRVRAQAAGFELTIASSFRDFDRQSLIWQEKIEGKRPVYCDAGSSLDVGAMGDDEVLAAILRWSALPGVSRHHWGTDFDIFDANAIAADYRVQLAPEEYLVGGPFFAFSQWLNQQVSDGHSEGFFLPYQNDSAGVAPEPWHISYAPVAEKFESLWSYDEFSRLLERGVWPLEASIRRQGSDIYRRFVAPAVMGAY